MVGFFNTYRKLYPVSDIRAHGHRSAVRPLGPRWLAETGVPPLSSRPLTGRRDDFVERYFQRAADQVVVILKAREPARILIAIGTKENRWHLQIA